MTDILNQFRQDDAGVLDRLVDGELSDAERRELLAGLDDKPGSWRRCALAFLEAQAWRQDLCEVRSEPANVDVNKSGQRSSGFWNVWGSRLALAASVLAAFGLGYKLNSAWLGKSNQPGPLEVAVQPAPEPAPQLVGGPPQPADARWKTFKLGYGNQGDSIEVPAMEAARIDRRWLDNQASALPADVLRAIEQAGHRVRRQRELWPVELRDGRRLIVPVEQVEVQYVGGEKFQ